MTRADLHNHLRTSSNLKETDFNRAIDMAQRRLNDGNGAIFGLVNFEDSRYETFIGFRGYDRIYAGNNRNAIYLPEKKVLVIKGQEVPTAQGHLLVLGLDYGTRLKAGKPLQETIKEAREQSGIIIADHPFYSHGVGFSLQNNPSLLEHFDAIETHNGEAAFCIPFINKPFPHGANNKAQLFYDIISAEFPNLGAVSASDGHSFWELGSSWVEMQMPDLADSSKFNETLKKNVQRTGCLIKRKNKNSILGALEHIISLAACVAYDKFKGEKK